MGNCCAKPHPEVAVKMKPQERQNLFSPGYRQVHASSGNQLVVLQSPAGRNIHQTYQLGREVGRGEFGVTYLCTDRYTKDVYACKSISKKNLKSVRDIEAVRTEVKIMEHLPRHVNIVMLRETYEDNEAVHLVMELCDGGELFDRIVARGHYTEEGAASVTKTIVEVVQICHKHDVMHRDLKPANFLFTKNRESAPLKAIDFGFSTFFKPGETFSEIVGSPYYMAPEVLKGNYGPEVDVWSAGAILYILLCGISPFWKVYEHGLVKAIIPSRLDFTIDPWPEVSEKAKDLVRKMLNPDPKERLTAQQILEQSEHIEIVELRDHISNEKMAFWK